MANLTTSLIVRLVDLVSGPARNAAGAIKGIGEAARQAGGAHVATLSGQFRQTAAASAAAAQQVRANAATAAATLGAPALIAGGYAAKLAFEFEKAGNMLEALGDATAGQRAEFEKFAAALNAKYPQSLGEIIRTGNELLKSGLNYDQMLGAIDQTLATAILGEMKPSEVATMISAALNAFQLPKETTEQAIASTGKVTDRMTYAAVKSTASLRDMGEMFKYVAAAAAATGSSIDDITAMALAFSANKINGSEAGVALRSAITRLATGLTKEGRAAMERGGLNLSDYIQGKSQITTARIGSGLLASGIDIAPIKGQIDQLLSDPALVNAPMKLAAKITQLVQENITRVGSAVDADKIAENVQESVVAAGSKVNLMKFFEDLKTKVASGSLSMGDVAKILEGRHFSRYQALLQTDLAKLRQQIEQEAEGYTQSRYRIAIKGVVGAVYEFSAALEKLSVAFGRAVFSQAAAGLNSIADAIGRLSETNPSILRAIAAIGALLAVLGPLGLLMSGTAASIGILAGAIKAVGLAGAAAALGIAAFARTMAAGAVVATVSALSSALVVLRGALLGVYLAMSAGGLGAAIAMVGASLLRLLSPMRLVTAAAVALRAAFMLTGVGAVLVGVAAAGTLIYNNWSGVKAMFVAFGTAFMDAIAPVRPALEPVISLIGSLWGLLQKVTGEIDEAKWREWGAAAGKAVGDVVAWFTDLPGRIAAAIGSLFEAGKKLMQSLLDGVKAGAQELIDYVSDLGSRIANAISGGVSSVGARIKGTFSAAPAPPAAPLTGARASGGSVSRGGRYLVGERGTEIFTPGASGTITANSAIGGAGQITVAPVFNFSGVGASDAEAITAQVRAVLRREVREIFRGVYADTGLRFA